MNRRNHLGIVFMAFAAFVIASGKPVRVMAQSPAAGITNAWSFEEGTGTTAADSIGGRLATFRSFGQSEPSGDHVQWINDAAPADGTTAIRLDGQGYIAFDCSAAPVNPPYDCAGSIGKSDFTTSLWMKTSVTSGYPLEYAIVLSKWGWGNDWFELRTIPGGVFNLEMLGSSGQPAAYVSFYTFGQHAPINDNVWHQIAIRRRNVGGGNEISLFVDGIRVGTGFSSHIYDFSDNSPLMIANSPISNPGQANGLFQGEVDNLQLYGRALSDSEILSLGRRTVADTTAPAVFVPAAIVVEAKSPSGTLVTYTATASDPDDQAGPVTCRPPSGSTFGMGTASVTCTSSDTHGNTGSASFSVTVQDTTPPVVLSAAPSQTSIWPANNKMTPIQLTVKATDLISTPGCGIVSVSSNEAGSGQWQITGNLALSLQASRNGNGNGRVYSIGVACFDAAGNASPTTTVTVTVPHDQGKSN